MNVRYLRGGGPPPQDDELLAIADGSFRLRRVNGFKRIGEFGGELPEEGQQQISGMVEAAANEPNPGVPAAMPPQVIETLVLDGREFDFNRQWEDDGALGTLVAALRHLTEELTDEPVAALELSIAEDGSEAVLRALGSRPVTADFSEATVEYSLFGADEDFLASGEVEHGLGAGEQELAPGWEQQMALPAMDFEPEKTLQVRVTLRVKYEDGWRHAQVSAVAGKGWF